MTSSRPDYRGCRKLLCMVHELHLRGHQGLRIMPYLAPSGLFWRCEFAPAASFRRGHGAILKARAPLIERYSSSEGRNYFGWTDMAHATPNALAERFLAAFPALATATRGSDWAYAGWFVELLSLTYPESLPYAIQDGPMPEGYIPCIGPVDDIRIPLPPPPLRV